MWTRRDVAGLASWDPDTEPERYCDGWGHNIAELYVRLKKRGNQVTIGARVPSAASVVLCSLDELQTWDRALQHGRIARLASAAVRHPRVIVVRVDLPLEVALPNFIGTEVMPNSASITEHDRQWWIPPLPQRGLIPRAHVRFGSVETVALMSRRENIPPYIDELRCDLQKMGVELRIVSDARHWHDFSDVDVVLCVRRFHSEYDDSSHLRKPATKLINAWAAQTLPIVGPEAAYLELVRPGIDGLVAATKDEIVAAVRQLRETPGLVARLEERGRARGEEFAPEGVLYTWENALASAASRPRHHALRSAVAFGVRALRARLPAPP